MKTEQIASVFKLSQSVNPLPSRLDVSGRGRDVFPFSGEASPSRVPCGAPPQHHGPPWPSPQAASPAEGRGQCCWGGVLGGASQSDSASSDWEEIWVRKGT